MACRGGAWTSPGEGLGGRVPGREWGAGVASCGGMHVVWPNVGVKRRGVNTYLVSAGGRTDSWNRIFPGGTAPADLLRWFGRWFAILFTPTLAIAQMVVYNVDFKITFGQNSIGPESLAHFGEFFFNIVSAGISFLFCIDNKLLCDRKQTELIGQWCGGGL